LRSALRVGFIDRRSFRRMHCGNTSGFIRNSLIISPCG
jgi:hypothetical protein